MGARALRANTVAVGEPVAEEPLKNQGVCERTERVSSHARPRCLRVPMRYTDRPISDRIVVIPISDMTRRPRSHELEAESRLAFSASLPSAWVFRDLTPDYGLDGIVEVFNEQGLATGHLFFVQLKATDQTAAAPRVRLPLRLLDYYTTLVLPVLLVVFHAPTSALYARWIGDNSPPPLRELGSLTIRMCAEDHWNPGG